MDQESPIRSATPHKSMAADVSPYGGKYDASAYKIRLEGMDRDEQNSLVRGKLNLTATEEIENPYPRGPPLTDTTNIHNGSLPI